MEEEKRKQKVWFITGASKGFGLELTKLVLSQGARVAATTRNPEVLGTPLSLQQENLLVLKNKCFPGYRALAVAHHFADIALCRTAV